MAIMSAMARLFLAGMGGIHHITDDRDGDGLDLVGWWVKFGVGSELALDTKTDLALACYARVHDPQTGKHLANST
jgi:hypothetical protein